MVMGETFSTMTRNSTSAAASATTSNLMSPITLEGKMISFSATNEPLKDQASSVLFPDEEMMHQSSISASPKMKSAGRKRGGEHYTDEEVDLLHKTVYNVQPTIPRDWNIVKAKFDEAAPQSARCRSANALRPRYYKSLSKEGGENGGPRKKQRTRDRASEYTEEETYTEEEADRLMAAVAQVRPRPHGGPTWEYVKEHFDQNDPSVLHSNASNRTATDLYNKFSRFATSMMIATLIDEPVSSRLTVAETLTTENDADKNAIGDAPVYNEADGEEPLGDESALSELRRVSFEMPLGVLEGTACANHSPLASDSTDSQPSDAVDAPSDNGAMDEEANRLSDAMIAFFDRYNHDDGMIANNERCAAIFSRLNNIERNMKTVNIKLGTIVSCVQSEEALERANQWLL